MKSILILGASSDIAKALSHKYASNGYNIILAGRNTKELELDAKNLELRYSIKTRTSFFDALEEEKHPEFYNAIKEEIIGVICVVGYLGDQSKSQKCPQETRKIIDTNYTGCVSILNIAANDFEEKKEGFIIGISSCAGDRGRASNYTYGSAKGAFSLYLSGLRNRLSKHDINVLTVKPGFVDTKMTSNLDLPKLLTAKPDEVANDIFKAQQQKKNILYTKWYWLFIMMIIKNIPEFVFKKMKL